MNRLKRRDDGATLVIVLVIVTVIAIVLGVVLSLVGTNVRTSVALSDQANSSYGVDGAAQVAIKQLQQGNFPGSNCGSVMTESSVFSNFVPASGSDSGASLAVRCSPNPTSVGGNGDPTQKNTSPGSALLTMDRNLGEDGIYVNVNAGPVKIRGGVFSNSAITAPSGLTNVWTPNASDPTKKTYNIARGACDPTKVIVANPAYGSTTCNIGATAVDTRGDDPGTLTPHGASYDTPPAPTGNGSIDATCSGSGKYRAVNPGRFSGATALAALNTLSGCSANIVWFKPGRYYFDFDGTWDVPNIYLIGGTPTIPLTSTPTPAQMPGACVAPNTATSSTSTGVEFIFGGNARLSVNNSSGDGAQMTICASDTSAALGGGPPIAVYGLKTALGGSYPVSAETLCPPTNPACALINTGNSPKTTLTIQGTTYAPRAFIVIILNNNTKKVFYWGLISYAISFTGTGSADVTNALVDVPDAAADPVPNPSIRYLTVYVCPGAATCDATGTVALTAKVKVATDGTVSVLSWSPQG
jgi:Flp pilus assembly pilin Flp